MRLYPNEIETVLSQQTSYDKNLLANPIKPEVDGPPVPPIPPIWPFIYIFSAASAAELMAVCLSPDYSTEQSIYLVLTGHKNQEETHGLPS